MKYAEPEQLCRDLAQLIGTRIVGLARVVVWVAGERFELLDALFIEAFRGDQPVMLEVSTDGHRQYSAWIRDGKYSIRGAWDDRERDELVTTRDLLVPFDADAIHAVWEVNIETAQELLVGVVIGAAGTARVCLNVDTDDVTVCEPSSLWSYLGHMLPRPGFELRVTHV